MYPCLLFVLVLALLVGAVSSLEKDPRVEEARELGAVPTWPASSARCYALYGNNNPCKTTSGKPCTAVKTYCQCGILYSWSSPQAVCQSCKYGFTCPGNGLMYGPKPTPAPRPPPGYPGGTPLRMVRKSPKTTTHAAKTKASVNHPPRLRAEEEK